VSADHLVLRVIVLGSRGFADVQGEWKLTQSICAPGKDVGCDVEMIVRSSYMPMLQRWRRALRRLLGWSWRASRADSHCGS
jgi:hypothetical protein